ncbi:MAG: TonB-dependent receptor [Balneolaceae bacterium]|nr:TonB-dependent receptor [Balneolaceae bacterium]
MIANNLLKLTFSALIGTFFLSTALFATTIDPVESDTTKTIDEIILDRITVVGQPIWMSRIPGAASYVSAEQLQRQNYTDINRILRNISGVNIQEEEGFGLRPNIGIRGAGNERSTKVNIMEDGILAAPAPYSAPAAYYFPNMARISSVEVRKGSSQIKYGPNTTGGAINLISTPIPAQFSGVAEVSLGERSANKIYANIGNRSERFGYLLEVNQVGDDGFKQLDNGGDTGFLVRDILGKVMFQTSNSASVYQRLEFKAGYHDEHSDETYLGLTRDDFSLSPMRRYAGSQADRIDTEHIQFSARHFALFSDNVDLTTTLYRNNFTRAWYKLHDLNTNALGIETGNLSEILRNPEVHQNEYAVLAGADSAPDALTVRNNNREYYSQGIQSILGVNFDIGSAQNQLEFGVRLHQDEEDRFQFEDDYQMLNGNMIITTPGIPGTQTNRVGSATALSVFVQDEIQWNNWTFTPGLRFENIWFTNRNYGTSDLERTGSNLNKNEYSVSIFLPGIGATYQVSNSFTLLSGIHRGFSPPSPGSSSDTRSEESINYELGFRYVNDLFQTELIGFYNDYDNLLGSDLAAGGGGGTTAQFNAGEVEVFGVEFSSNIDFGLLLNTTSVSIPVNLNYTYTNATFQNSFSSGFGPWGNVESGDEIPFIPRHQFNSGVSFIYKGFDANINASYMPQMRTAAGSGSFDPLFSTDSFFVVDLSTSYNIHQYVNLFVNIRNLLDETYITSDRPAGVRPGLPRTLMGGMKVSF